MNYETFVTKHTAHEKIFYLKVLWKQNPKELFQIIVSCDDISWSGVFTTEAADEYRKEYTEDTEAEYYENVKRAFKQKNEHFNYDFNSFKDSRSSAKFTWSKKFEGGKIPQGSVEVLKDNEPITKDILIDDLLQENLKLKDVIEKSKKNAQKCEDELERCKNINQQFVDMKTTVEETLYGKFIQVLNTKKQRIKLLEQNLQKLGISNVNSESD